MLLFLLIVAVVLLPNCSSPFKIEVYVPFADTKSIRDFLNGAIITHLHFKNFSNDWIRFVKEFPDFFILNSGVNLIHFQYPGIYLVPLFFEIIPGNYV